jgi:hypothetical protein
MMRTLLICMVSALLVQGAFVNSAEAKKKKKKRPPAPPADIEAETEAPAADESAGANGAEGEAANGESKGKGKGKGKSKSLAERLEDDGSEGALRSSRRMEFDERLVKGQAAKSGAVYLFKRIPRRLPGLVPLRRSYRRRIVEPVLGGTELKPARYSFEVVKEKKAKKRKEEMEKIEEATAKADAKEATEEAESDDEVVEIEEEK